ncbi:MAG: hypothetical protein JSU67_06960 [Gammaproteobacteria bacterium]|nr:MAG: hypothetical protein EP300_14485 [Gammaproteobacteria bacterium]UCH41400.1 MAG: hypothetical protein JSU67_06960 [Gammaproteobacteria bacterium]
MLGETQVSSTRVAGKYYLPGLLALFCFAISPSSFAQDLAFVCENNDLSRSIEVVAEPGFACRVKYTKGSSVTYPWSARNEAGYCGSRALFLVDKLKSWGWQCDSAEDVRSILVAHIDRYHRHIRILNNVGKTCHFYPGEVEYGNLCGDGRQEGVIVYTCETGTDDWDQHLAVFLEIESEPLIMEVGSSRSRQVTSYHVDNRRLVMETQPYDAADNTAGSGASHKDVTIQCRSGGGSKWELFEN